MGKFIVTYDNSNGKLYEGKDFEPRKVMVVITTENNMSDAKIEADKVMLDTGYNIDDHWKINAITELF